MRVRDGARELGRGLCAARAERRRGGPERAARVPATRAARSPERVRERCRRCAALPAARGDARAERRRARGLGSRDGLRAAVEARRERAELALRGEERVLEQRHDALLCGVAVARAVRADTRAVRLRPRSTQAWLLLGYEYLNAHNVRAATAAYRAALDVDAREFRAWHGLAQTYLMLHQRLHAVYYARRACELQPADPRMWDFLAQCYSESGDLPSALRASIRAFSLAPEFVSLLSLPAHTLTHFTACFVLYTTEMATMHRCLGRCSRQ